MVANLKSKSLRVALAGAGMISWHHLTAWHKAGDRVQLVAVCDPDIDKATGRAKEFLHPQRLSRCLMRCSRRAGSRRWTSHRRATHAAWTEAAAARGIDVLCQKPMTPTLAESEALVRRVEGKARLMVHEELAVSPLVPRTEAMDRRRRDRRGAIRAHGDMISSGILPDANGRRPSFERQPFMQHEEQVVDRRNPDHHLDTMRYLCGELTVVGARTAHTASDVRGETLAAIFLETAAGAPVEVSGTMAAPGYPARPPDRMEIVGTRADAVFDDWRLQLLGAGTGKSSGFTTAMPVTRRASMASSRTSSTASKPARRSKLEPTTISRPCVWSKMRIGPPGCALRTQTSRSASD